MNEREQFIADVERARKACVATLLAERGAEGQWTGRLSSSALATATAVSALAVGGGPADDELINAGVKWLAETQNADGGWGDTTNSPSNLATTVLVRAAIALSGAEKEYSQCIQRAETYIAAQRKGRGLREALEEVYGADRTFAVPILANAALAGMVDWEEIPRLPFELACLPQAALSMPRLHVVSYAMPALIAIGQLIHERRRPPNFFARAMRRLAVKPTLKKLAAIQPTTGGYLEATPLTSFVVMSLAGAGRGNNEVAVKGLEFIRASARADGSWAIDSNLSVWLTTQAVETLAPTGELANPERTREWLEARQHRKLHLYTGSAPGGWSWTELDGGVPDADDTAGALLALKSLEGNESAAKAGLKWLADLQNDDGGWPTFCRGWQKLPMDRSGADLTAHAIRALAAWAENRQAIEKGFAYLRRSQHANGSWEPLWFGNQESEGKTNPVYGTAKVLRAYSVTGRADCEEARRGVQYLMGAQNADGGWGGARGTRSSVEETALAVTALAEFAENQKVMDAVTRGARYLAGRMASGSVGEGTPMGLYFTRLWYWERLYAPMWTAEALGAVKRIVDSGRR